MTLSDNKMNGKIICRVTEGSLKTYRDEQDDNKEKSLEAYIVFSDSKVCAAFPGDNYTFNRLMLGDDGELILSSVATGNGMVFGKGKSLEESVDLYNHAIKYDHGEDSEDLIVAFEDLSI
jgi:hypothetical protein